MSDLPTTAAQNEPPTSTKWRLPTSFRDIPLDLTWRYQWIAGSSGVSFENRLAGTRSDESTTTATPLQDQEEAVALPVLTEPLPKVTAPHVRVTQNWEGVVTEVADQFFSARIAPLADGGPEFVVDIAMDRVDDDDLPLVVPGAPLYLTIGFMSLGVGRKSQLTTIRLRRLPRWSRLDPNGWLERAQARRLRTGIYDAEESEEA